ncbi:hypothetical protein HDV01_001889 [Terramyces sp. JEL0728]|nr:hypothetical protein HDV01_001889 [Terramyces sp. JEL0728]
MKDTILSLENTLKWDMQLGKCVFQSEAKPGDLIAVIGEHSLFMQEITKSKLHSKIITRNDYAQIKDDLLSETSTVYDTLMFTVQLKYPCSIALKQKQSIVESLIYKFGLKGADKIKNTNRKMVLLAQEMATNPELILLHAPTVQLLDCARKLAKDNGNIALVALDNPKLEYLQKVDKIILLGHGNVFWYGTVEGIF